MMGTTVAVGVDVGLGVADGALVGVSVGLGVSVSGVVSSSGSVSMAPTTMLLADSGVPVGEISGALKEQLASNKLRTIMGR
jgi:hypothetical protein